MATTGRKDPCPCGSGKTYESCCLQEDLQAVDTVEVTIAWEEAEPARSENFRDRMISSDDLQKLCGLSREEMYFLLYEPFSTPELVSFNLDLLKFPGSTFLRLFRYLIEGITTEGLKATAKGNLPPTLVRDAALQYYGEERYHEVKTYMTFRTEMDFGPLHTVRLTAQLAGFVRKYRGRFELTKAGREVFERGLDGPSFQKLFMAYGTKFNWAYNDGYPDLPIVQQAFLFTLYLLHRYGDKYRAASFYEDLFLAAFPEEIAEVPASSSRSGEEIIKSCYTVRSLSRFAEFLGFLEIDNSTKKDPYRKPSIRKTAFLDQWIRFGGLDDQHR